MLQGHSGGTNIHYLLIYSWPRSNDYCVAVNYTRLQLQVKLCVKFTLKNKKV